MKKPIRNQRIVSRLSFNLNLLNKKVICFLQKSMLAGLLNLGVNVLDKLQNHFVERYSNYFNSMISTVDFRAVYDKELSRHHCCY